MCCLTPGMARAGQPGKCAARLSQPASPRRTSVSATEASTVGRLMVPRPAIRPCTTARTSSMSQTAMTSSSPIMALVISAIALLESGVRTNSTPGCPLVTTGAASATATDRGAAPPRRTSGSAAARAGVVRRANASLPVLFGENTPGRSGGAAPLQPVAAVRRRNLNRPPRSGSTRPHASGRNPC